MLHTVYTVQPANDLVELLPKVRFLVLTVYVSLVSFTSSFANDRPNFLLIRVDDVGFAGLGC